MGTPDFLSPTDTFIHRHIGPTDADACEMLVTLGLQSLCAAVVGVAAAVVPAIRVSHIRIAEGLRAIG